ncbi:hypothetical protein [Ferrovibrio xuzhouensis]|uniref:Helix-turn-helix domain-containing protein n=1 Tax=Ferrovibrio xuzhouensis TaxID=1576914 RepID=A0ABV7VC98_9PROT
MTTPASVTKGEFAAMRQVSPGRVSQWISEGKISGLAIVGEGRSARIDPVVACQQLGVTLDPVQSVANGLQSTIPLDGQASPNSVQPEVFTDQRRLAKIKADQAEMAYERDRREFEAESGRYLLADQAAAAWSKIFGKVIADLEGAIPDMAVSVAQALGSDDPKKATVALRNAFRTWRGKLTNLAAAEAAALDRLVVDPERLPPADDATERRSDTPAAA